jgi:hypothetical protein
VFNTSLFLTCRREQAEGVVALGRCERLNTAAVAEHEIGVGLGQPRVEPKAVVFIAAHDTGILTGDFGLSAKSRHLGYEETSPEEYAVSMG